MRITANRSVGEWNARIGDAVVASRILGLLLDPHTIITIPRERGAPARGAPRFAIPFSLERAGLLPGPHPEAAG